LQQIEAFQLTEVTSTVVLVNSVEKASAVALVDVSGIDVGPSVVVGSGVTLVEVSGVADGPPVVLDVSVKVSESSTDVEVSSAPNVVEVSRGAALVVGS
jgi:hypothetical protein